MNPNQPGQRRLIGKLLRDRVTRTGIPADELVRRNHSRWADDGVAQRLVAEYPDGMDLAAIAAYFGTSEQNVHALEKRAVHKLLRAVVVYKNAQAHDLFRDLEHRLTC